MNKAATLEQFIALRREIAMRLMSQGVNETEAYEAANQDAEVCRLWEAAQPAVSLARPDRSMIRTINGLINSTEAEIASARVVLNPANPVLRDHYGTIVVSGVAPFECPMQFTIQNRVLVDCSPATSPATATVFYSDDNARTASDALRDKDGNPVTTRLVSWPVALREWLPKAEANLAQYRAALQRLGA